MKELLKNLMNSLTDEQKEKAKTCKDLNELTACLGEMGVSLPDELLDAVAGGIILRVVSNITGEPTGCYIVTNENVQDYCDPDLEWTYDLADAIKKAHEHGWSIEMIDF